MHGTTARPPSEIVSSREITAVPVWWPAWQTNRSGSVGYAAETVIVRNFYIPPSRTKYTRLKIDNRRCFNELKAVHPPRVTNFAHIARTIARSAAEALPPIRKPRRVLSGLIQVCANQYLPMRGPYKIWILFLIGLRCKSRALAFYPLIYPIRPHFPESPDAWGALFADDTSIAQDSRGLHARFGGRPEAFGRPLIRWQWKEAEICLSAIFTIDSSIN